MKLLYKYYLMIALPLVLCLFLVGTGLSFQMYNYSVKEKHDSLELAARRVSPMVEELYYNHSLANERTLKRILSTMTNNEQIHIIICDVNGQIFFTSDSYGNNYMNSYISRDILEQTEKNESFSSIGTLNNLYSGKNYTVGVTARDDLSHPIAYVYVTTSISNIEHLMTYVRNIFFYLSILVFLIAALVFFFIVKRMTKPIKEITIASSKFAKGDFSSRVSVYSNDEIGELTVAFNNMADSLEKSEDLRRTFIANVSHELRSPMTSIVGFVDGILDKTIPPEKEEHYLSLVSEEVHRLSRLVSSMLDITVLQSRDVTADCKTFDFCEILKRCIISLETRVSDKNLTLNINLPDREIFIKATEDTIFQVVYNLVDNAIKFSNASTEIDISAHTKSDKLTFSVRNYGIEIPKDELNYVFDRFHKTDRSRSKDKTGLGLGLYIAKTIINQHNGKIWAESYNNHTEFFFTLPISNEHKE